MDFSEFKSKYEHKEVKENLNQVTSNPFVSVCVQTYQHVSYIRQCLDGILMQETDFSFEILLGDDHSTDGTRDICLEYAERYPDKIRLFLHHRKNNIPINGRPTGRFNFLYNLYTSNGKYIALCEGDDYWTDPLKLQKQVDFLENNHDCSICFHATYHNNQRHPERSREHRPKNIPKNCKFTIDDAILGGGGFMATNSMVFRKEDIGNQPSWMVNCPVGDAPLMLFLATKGDIGYIDELMGAYRIQSEGSWSSSMNDLKKREAHHYGILKMWNDFNEWTKFSFDKTVKKKIRINKLNFFKLRIKMFQKKIYSYISKRN